MAYQQVSGLGLSLKPPKWLRNTIRSGIQSVEDAARESAAKAADAAAAAARAKNTPAPGPAEQVNAAVQNIPGGWLTIAAAGLGVLLLMRRK
jgi:hypothetical protein